MALTPLPTPPSRADSASFAARADAFFSALPNFVLEFNAFVPYAVAGAVTGSMTVTGNLIAGPSLDVDPVANNVGGFQTGSGYTRMNQSGDKALLIGRSSSDGACIALYRQGLAVGSISVTTSATAYNTSSDYRLKTGVSALTGSGEFIDSLLPKRWTWARDGAAGCGFLAHEVAAVSPGSVSGEKDATDASGQPVYQAMEYGSSEFIANIVAELQSLRSRVAELEAAG